MTMEFTAGNSPMDTYVVTIQGPREKHEMVVFANGWDSAAKAGVAKVKDKIRRHNYKGWGPVKGPWTVLGVSLC